MLGYAAGQQRPAHELRSQEALSASSAKEPRLRPRTYSQHLAVGGGGEAHKLGRDSAGRRRQVQRADGGEGAAGGAGPQPHGAIQAGGGQQLGCGKGGDSHHIGDGVAVWTGQADTGESTGG